MSTLRGKLAASYSSLCPPVSLLRRKGSLLLLLLWLSGSLLHILDTLIGVESSSSFQLGLLDGLAGSLQESTLLELN